MERIAFHLTIRNGQQEAYREAHRDVPEDLERAYLESDAGVETYSVFEKDGYVFGFMEVENPEAIKEIMENSDAQAEWEVVMDPILEDSDGDEWMDEVYRMV